MGVILYLESQEHQDMKRLFNFTRTQEGRRVGVVVCLGMEERGVYIVVVEKIRIEGHLMRVDKNSKRIMNLDPILVFRESWYIKFGGWWA